jgi:hypothetical protein
MWYGQIPREQVSEGLFFPRPLSQWERGAEGGVRRINDLNRQWRIIIFFNQVRIKIVV